MREPAAVPIAPLIDELTKTVNGFKDIEKAAQRDWKALSPQTAVNFAKDLYRLDVRQARMYSVFLLGYSASDDALQFMKDVVSNDGDWRVQEILAKAFDEFCKTRGYENSLPVIDMWLSDENPNVRRAVSEGLRIWTGRLFLKSTRRRLLRGSRPTRRTRANTFGSPSETRSGTSVKNIPT